MKDNGEILNDSEFKDLEIFKELVGDYFNMQSMYMAAVKEMNARLEILDSEFQLLHKHNPIHYIQTRIKRPDSIRNKIKKKGLPLSLQSVKENVLDIAGMRVICHYVDDIYIVEKLLKQQDDLIFVEEEDYIKNPKESGYRSLHIIVKVPVNFSAGKEYVPVEIQIRTVAMDFWASLEHQLRYKSPEDVPQFIVRELKECSETINETDKKMEKIYKFLASI